MLKSTSLLRRLHRNVHGNMALLFGLASPLVVGAAGLGVETGYWYLLDRELQTAADMAAYAGAVELRASATRSVVDSVARQEALTQGFDDAAGTAVVNTPPLSGSYRSGRAVEVLLTREVPRLFTALFVQEPLTLSARGVAQFEDGGTACVLALSPEEAGAVTFTGNALSLLNGCNVMSNSLASDAVVVTGSADVTVPCVLAAGGVDVDSGLNLTLCRQPATFAPPAADPFANLVEPSVGGACRNLPSGGGSTTLTPGRFCGGGVLKGDITLSPGVYVIDGGNVRVNATAKLIGSGVTLFFTNNATIDINGSAQLSLSAPVSGPFKGMVMWGDGDNDPVEVKLNGNAASRLTGAVYFPRADVEFLGNFSGSNGCMRLVARTIRFSGSTSMNADCTAAGMDDVLLPGRVVLVE